MVIQNFRDKDKAVDERVDYSKYFHDERIPLSERYLSEDEPVRLIDLSSPRDDHKTSFTAPQELTVYFQCELCDMLVGENDKLCPFCGAEFADDELDEPLPYSEHESLSNTEEKDDQQIHEPEPLKDERKPDISDPSSEDVLEKYDEMDVLGEKSADDDITGQPVKVKVLELLSESGDTQNDKQSYTGGSGGSSGFSRSAKLLQKMETFVDEASDFGAETREARKLLVAAWKACEEGNWNIVTSLAEETKKTLVPNVTNMIRSQISSLREVILDMKYSGVYVAPQITKIKLIRKAMDEVRLDDAIELTMQLIEETREARSLPFNQ